MAEPVRMGFLAPTSREEVAELEALGAHSLWVGGHVASLNPTREPLVWLARLVEQTRTVRIGTATLILPLYPPGLLAKQLADLDEASAGRLTVGVGVGGEYPSDFDACGVPREERGSRANEAIGLLRAFWTAEPVTHAGRHHRHDQVRIHPAPAQPGGPPIVVTGRRDPAMRRAAQLGDGWMPYLYSPERYAASVAEIRAQAERAGRDLRDFGWYAYVFVSLDDDEAQARAEAEQFLGGTYRGDFSAMLQRVACVGTAEQVTARLRAFVDAGAEHLVLVPCARAPQTRRRLLAEVLPALTR
ncbi:LLM class F420-dependent oxidoreductase [Frankia sp. CcI49]|uniref:LLM class flavin-dependent oxidoreductase n=1 Tax=unclassified Frankia TaxID=2632575 RepID=UPI0006CA1748|nr:MULTISPECIES: LLM class flavin-dependent oxidoreductase [unclassified Frankia]KPM54118.1 luciferase [Frankia sp. R43]ONH61547.1 LLM class F420-dependent oxidoreductase [Frankia sp. CcI49]